MCHLTHATQGSRVYLSNRKLLGFFYSSDHIPSWMLIVCNVKMIQNQKHFILSSTMKKLIAETK